MSNISDRLLEERKRLLLNQEDMAKAGGVAKRSYCHYEAGERAPDAIFLAAIAEVGADVAYILTGVRLAEASVPAPCADPLARRKAQAKALIDQMDDPRMLDAVQADIEEIKRVKGLERRVAELERRAG